MSLEVTNVLKCCRGVQLNNIAMHSGKQMTAITKRTLQNKIHSNKFSTTFKVIKHVIFELDKTQTLEIDLTTTLCRLQAYMYVYFANDATHRFACFILLCNTTIFALERVQRNLSQYFGAWNNGGYLHTKSLSHLFYVSPSQGHM